MIFIDVGVPHGYPDVSEFIWDACVRFATALRLALPVHSRNEEDIGDWDLCVWLCRIPLLPGHAVSRDDHDDKLDLYPLLSLPSRFHGARHGSRSE